MQSLIFAAILVFAYLLGSIPFGLIIVRLKTGKDVRQVESGRTGGTNAMRAAGFLAGFATAVLDLLKAAAAVWLARWALPESYWLHVLAPLAAVLGHNYSIFLIERGPEGRLRLRGGAGGAPTGGGAFGLWPPTVLFMVPLAVFVVFIIGYASLATLSVGLMATAIFAYRAWIGVSPWQYIFYGIFAEILLIWALRPNIRRLLQGNERRVGLFARKARANTSKQNPPRNHNTFPL
jgi:glycerol-3-phosphate acyltransferase PlsY